VIGMPDKEELEQRITEIIDSNAADRENIIDAKKSSCYNEDEKECRK
jgi:hypothetical protein